MNVLEFVRRQFVVALRPLTSNVAEFVQHVRPAQDPKFGDYQANCAMPLQRELREKPRAIAERIVDGLPDRTLFDSIEIAGPGFINLRLGHGFLADQLKGLLSAKRLGLDPVSPPTTLVIDYSSPNVAKPMHVGHLRSTIIGDALARMYRALEWTVHSDNHLGDWGTQFGMLIHGWRTLRDDQRARERPLEELCRLYPLVNQMAEANEQVAAAARAETAKLHDGDPDNIALWQQFMPWCLDDLQRIYDRLDIRFDHQLGESFYQPMLAAVVEELLQKGIAVESEGAICVFFPDPEGKRDESGQIVQLLPPAIIRKADGAFTYATSDLACIRYRVNEFKPNVIAYVVDDRQSDHFRQLFATARRMGYENVQLVHIAFGKITGKDGKPFKTREGGTIGLADLLDEAVARAQKVVDENSPDIDPEERRKIAETVGVGAVKYADLCQNRVSDYVFDWDKMISLNGNTSTYLQYVYARNRSIFRKGQVDPGELTAHPPAIDLRHASERALGMELLRYPESVTQAALDFKPNLLTNYLFELANVYNSFFRDCPVLRAETAELRSSRLALCELTARTIKAGLALLGIGVVDRM
jgi:arginyl-tRNA synthetase